MPKKLNFPYNLFQINLYQTRDSILFDLFSRYSDKLLQRITLPLYLYPVESRIQDLMGQDMFHPLQIHRNIQPSRSFEQTAKGIRRL